LGEFWAIFSRKNCAQRQKFRSNAEISPNLAHCCFVVFVGKRELRAFFSYFDRLRVEGSNFGKFPTRKKIGFLPSKTKLPPSKASVFICS
jgi:hypothetical protein